MYKPIQTGIPRILSGSVHYQEFFSDDPSIKEMVYCFWTLRTDKLEPQDFGYLVLPDGCIDIVFDASKEQEFDGSLVMTPAMRAEVIKIRSDSSYIGIRLLPGVWRADPVEVMSATKFYNSLANYDLTSVSAQLRAASSPSQTISILQAVIRQLQIHKVIGASRLIALLLATPFASVQDMMIATGYSRRQLQRILRDSVGYTPHDFIKIIRFQRALVSSQGRGEYYFDQSHFIRECKRITNMTPVQLSSKYQLMTDISNK